MLVDQNLIMLNNSGQTRLRASRSCCFKYQISGHSTLDKYIYGISLG